MADTDNNSHAIAMEEDPVVSKMDTSSTLSGGGNSAMNNATETTNLNPNGDHGNMHEYNGGFNAHIVRRVYHVISLTLAPWLFYWYFEDVSNGLDISVSKLLSIVIIVQVIVEAIRIKFGYIGFGQREYERHQISAQAWGLVSGCIVVMLAYPRAYSISPAFKADRKDTSSDERHACYAQIGLPIVWGLAIGDPLVGELKRLGYEVRERCVIAWLALCIVWIVATIWCGTSWWLVLIMPPVAVAAEYPSLRAIDDNGMMLLVPLLLSLVLEPWFQTKCDAVVY